MYKIEPKNKFDLLQAALGVLPADLLIQNGQLVNVFSGEIYLANIYIYDGFICHVEKEVNEPCLPAKKVIDAKQSYVIPGFIDSHIHIESSMLTPRNFAKAVIVHGTTTVITDPHEIANVYGVEAVRYMHRVSEDLPMRQLIDIPSCVPAVPGLENSGADFSNKEVASLLDLKRVVGLAEVMDYVGVIHGEKRIHEIIETAQKAGLYIQGHAPFVKGRELSAYLIGGPKTCHESREEWEFIEKIRAGMIVDVRESSISKNMEAAVHATKDLKFFDHFCMCTDDKEPDDILNVGHMNGVVSRAVKLGLDKVVAIKSATINNAKAANISNLGAIAPGYVADILLCDNLEDFKPSTVIFEGQVVAKNGKLVVPIPDYEDEIEKRNSINVSTLHLDQFSFKAPIENGKVKVNVLTFDNYELSTTDAVCEEIPVKNGFLDISHDENLKYVMVINRHGKNTIGYGVARNFGTKEGAIASTVAHDSHNLIVVFDQASNGYLAAKNLVEVGGGMSCVKDGKILSTLTLQVGGVMSTKSVEEVAKDAGFMKKAMQSIGLTQMENPLLRIVTLALPVIPNCKMSDLGMIDVNNKQILPLYPR